jgi:hypothetical protein
MPVTKDDLDEYSAFVVSVAKELECLPVPPSNKLLWHYTNGNGLLGIVRSGTLYTTQVSCLNDSAEIKYASRLFKSALAKLKEENKDPEATGLFDAVGGYFETDDDEYAGTLPYFVACFTELEDSVSQWQGYGCGENGYAIGLEPALLTQMGGLLARVNYDRAKHEEMAVKVANGTLEFYRKGLEAKRAETPEKWAQEFLPLWDERITELAPLIKDPCWAHEKEYRIVRLLVRGQLPELVILQKDTMMTRHIPLKATSDCRYPILPIKQVIVGPCPHPSISRVSVDTLLRQHGYPSGIAISSKRPYRKT